MGYLVERNSVRDERAGNQRGQSLGTMRCARGAGLETGLRERHAGPETGLRSHYAGADTGLRARSARDAGQDTGLRARGLSPPGERKSLGGFHHTLSGGERQNFTMIVGEEMVSHDKVVGGWMVFCDKVSKI